MNRFPLLWALVAPIAAPAVAQEFVFVPASAASSDARSVFPFAGVDHDARQQILIDPEHLTDALGRDLIGLAIRRDAGWTDPLDGGLASVSILIAPATRSARRASPRFADNLDPSPATHVVVFSGTVGVPASSDASARPVSWSNAGDVVQVTFTTPYRYLGGGLCIDVVGTPVAGQESTFWSVDAAMDTATGSVSIVGDPCGQVPGGGSYPLSNVPEYALVAGSTAQVRGFAAASAPGALFIGGPFPAFDLSLLGIGGAGCMLHVQPFVSLPVTFQPRGPSDPMGFARVALTIPPEQSSLGFAFRAQFVWVAAVVETSNAMDCVVASSLPMLGMSTVFAQAGTASNMSQGAVRANRAPVLRFELR